MLKGTERECTQMSAEDEGDTTNSVGGYVEISLIDELCEEHGGIDLAKTLQEEFNKK